MTTRRSVTASVVIMPLRLPRGLVQALDRGRQPDGLTRAAYMRMLLWRGVRTQEALHGGSNGPARV